MKPQAPAGVKAEGVKGSKGSVKGGSVVSGQGGSASGRNKSGNASEAGGGIRNQVLHKIKADAQNMGVTGVNASLGLDYIRFVIILRFSIIY